MSIYDKLDSFTTERHALSYDYFEFPHENLSNTNSKQYQTQLNVKILQISNLLRDKEANTLAITLPHQLTELKFYNYIKVLCKKHQLSSLLDPQTNCVVLYREKTTTEAEYQVPLIIENIQFTKLDGNSAEITWSKPVSTHQITGYEISVKNSNTSLKFTSKEEKANILPLTEATKYELIVQAVSKIGLGCKHPAIIFITPVKPFASLYYWGGLSLNGECTISPEQFPIDQVKDIKLSRGVIYTLSDRIMQWSLINSSLKSTPCALMHVKQIACGDSYIMALDHFGKLYSWGNSEYGALGQGEIATINHPTPVNIQNYAIYINAFENTSLAIAEKEPINSVYLWGICTDFRSKEIVPAFYNMTQLATPQQLPTTDIKSKIHSASMGDAAVFLVTQNEIYPMGANIDGRLGLDSSIGSIMLPIKSIAFPTQIKNIISFSSGYYHSLAVVDTDNGTNVYGWGDNTNKKCVPSAKKHIYQPTLHESAPKNVVSVSCGLLHSMMLTSDGEVYAYGETRNGVLGVTSSLDSLISKPTKVCKGIGGKQVKKICADREISIAFI